MVEYAKETYSKTGAHLLGSVAIVHPFVLSTLLTRAETAVGGVGEVSVRVPLMWEPLCIVPVHWVPPHNTCRCYNTCFNYCTTLFLNVPPNSYHKIVSLVPRLYRFKQS